MTFLTSVVRAPAVLAAAAMMATPAAATDLPVHARVTVAPAANNHGPYVGTSIGWGTSWGSGWGGWGSRHRRHRGSTAGDILTGVLILGTIAAVANAAKRSEPQYRYPDQRRYPDNRRHDDRRYDNRTDGPQGLQGAADICLRAVERDARAREVTRVERDANGWLVTGVMADGGAFSCTIGGDGRITRVDVGGRAVPYASGTDINIDTYRSASADTATEARPEYPGGPLPGERPEDLPAAPTPQG